MRCVDVNVLVHAHRPESPNHAEVRAWLDLARTDRTPLGLADLVCSGFLRIVTHPKVFNDPTPLPVALDFVDALRSSPATRSVSPGERHWEIFVDLCREAETTGNLIPDAYLAAIALEHGATWVTADRGFSRFPGLPVVRPTGTPT